MIHFCPICHRLMKPTGADIYQCPKGAQYTGALLQYLARRKFL